MSGLSTLCAILVAGMTASGDLADEIVTVEQIGAANRYLRTPLRQSQPSGKKNWARLVNFTADDVTAEMLHSLSSSDTLSNLLPRNQLQWPKKHALVAGRSHELDEIKSWKRSAGDFAKLFQVLGNPWREERIKAFVAARVRWSSIEALTLHPDGHQLLAELLDQAQTNPDRHGLRVQALRALAFYGQNKTVLLNWTPPSASTLDAVVELAGSDSDPRVRVAALETLYSLRDQPRLKRRFSNELSQAVRWYISLELDEVTELRRPMAEDNYAWTSMYPGTTDPAFHFNYASLKDNAPQWLQSLSTSYWFEKHWVSVVIWLAVLLVVLILAWLVRQVVAIKQAVRSLVDRAEKQWTDTEVKFRILEELKKESPRFTSLEDAVNASVEREIDAGRLNRANRRNGLKQHASGLLRVSKQVCAIGTKSNHIGSGILVDANHIMTAGHVAKALEATSENAFAQFGCIDDSDFESAALHQIQAREIACSELPYPDYAVLRLETPVLVTKRDRLRRSFHKLTRDQPLVIVGHPGYREDVGAGPVLAVPMQYTMGGLHAPPNLTGVMTYNARTEPGSSGAPVLDSALAVVGLHFGTVTEKVGARDEVLDNNTGYWIETIAKHFEESGDPSRDQISLR